MYLSVLQLNHMIPKEIQALFEFIDFLGENKQEYIEKYIPLCNELEELGNQRSTLKPNENYKDKQSYEHIQNQITEKFTPITENIYKPITNKLKELGIWPGDDPFVSIHNNNISSIEDFKRNFTKEDVETVMQYKQKYLNFRIETNSYFLCLELIISCLDEIMKELFDFFKDTKENEFDSFEAKTIEVKDFSEIAKSIQESKGKNVKFAIPNETFFDKNFTTPTTKTAETKKEIIMGDKIEFGNISNNSGQVNIGKNIKTKTEVNGNDGLAKKSYRWQKRDTIISIIIGIIGIIIAYLSM